MSGDADLSAFVLAGGRSTRMGEDKAFLVFDGQTLIERAIGTAREVTGNVRIVGDGARFATLAGCVEDTFPGSGPLGGIHAALLGSATALNLIVAVDMPFISPGLLRFMVARARDAKDAMVTLPRAGHRWQPLCAVYHREFAQVSQRALHAGRFRIDVLFDQVGVCAVEEDELAGAGFSGDQFQNLNTPEDVARANRR